MSSNRIILIGYRGTGKTTIGKRLAELLDQEFFDTDAEIEKRTGSSIPGIFSLYGEDGFRDIERDVIASIPESATIISTGGGSILNPDNRRDLRKNSTIFWLYADADTIYQRIETGDRPALTSLPPRSEIDEVLSIRTPLYRSFADYTITSGTMTVDSCVEEIAYLYATGGDVVSVRTDWIFDNPLPLSCDPDHTRNLLASINNPRVRLFGIVGYPCGHSRSPLVWNHLFKEFRMDNALYTWFEVKTVDQLFKKAVPAGIKGLSVTIPHKKTVIPYIDEVKHDARTIGAVNTILFQGGRSYGYNTDWLGIYHPLQGFRGGSACVLGAGGGASAAIYALEMRGYDVTILNRTPEKAKKLAARFGCQYGSLDQGDISSFDLVLNTTPVGMYPDTSIPVNPSLLHSDMTVFDLVYTPPKTPLIRAAEEAGCTTIEGTEMFVYQLTEQFSLLTGLVVSPDCIREVLL